ncbi:hypothetical protein NIES2101_23655 [Calothrix sp. HK-06]|nr:hypothetical protein NIES2101_23655 [Calothrix sp. HK-06]
MPKKLAVVISGAVFSRAESNARRGSAFLGRLKMLSLLALDFLFAALLLNALGKNRLRRQQIYH